MAGREAALGTVGEIGGRRGRGGRVTRCAEADMGVGSPRRAEADVGGVEADGLPGAGGDARSPREVGASHAHFTKSSTTSGGQAPTLSTPME